MNENEKKELENTDEQVKEQVEPGTEPEGTGTEALEAALEDNQADGTKSAKETQPDPEPDSGQEEVIEKEIPDGDPELKEKPKSVTKPVTKPVTKEKPEDVPKNSAPGPIEEDTDPSDLRSRNALPELGNDADDLFTIAVEVFDDNGAGFDILGYSHGKTPEQAIRIWGTQYPDGLNYRNNGIWDPRLNGSKVLALQGDALEQANNQ